LRKARRHAHIGQPCSKLSPVAFYSLWYLHSLRYRYDDYTRKPSQTDTRPTLSSISLHIVTLNSVDVSKTTTPVFCTTRSRTSVRELCQALEDAGHTCVSVRVNFDFLQPSNMDKYSTDQTGSEKLDQHHLPQSPTSSDDSQTEESVLDKDVEKRLLRKLDLHIIPILWLIFMLAFLDRTNVCTFSTLCQL
jgi:hypothetical protein